MDDHSGHSHSRAIDIHAHYFAQNYLNLFNEQREKYGTDYRSGKEGWYFKSPIAEMGPLPNRMIDIKERVAEMDATGIAVQALSLTAPMVYWAEPEFSHKLARAWNDDAVAAHKAYPTASWCSRPCRCSTRIAPSTNSTALASCRAYAASTWARISTIVTSTTRCSSRYSRVSKRSICRCSCIRSRPSAASGSACSISTIFSAIRSTARSRHVISFSVACSTVIRNCRSICRMQAARCLA